MVSEIFFCKDMKSGMGGKIYTRHQLQVGASLSRPVAVSGQRGRELIAMGSLRFTGSMHCHCGNLCCTVANQNFCIACSGKRQTHGVK